jgi:hypothetical protein
MKVDDNITWEDAKIKAIKLAQINAIENAFGKAIIQDNSTYIQNTQRAESVKTSSAFNFISNTYVKGDWIEDIITPVINKIQEGDNTWIKVNVKGKVREIKELEVKFIANSLTCPDLKCKTQKFNDGQDFFLYFKSPEDGFLSCYMTDPETKYTFLLLPYKNSAIFKKCIPIKADRDYIFFSKKHNYFEQNATIDEQVLSISSDKVAEKYQIWLLFSTESIEKPVLEDEGIIAGKFLDQSSIQQGFTMPKGIESDKFREWLQEYRLHNKSIQLSSIFIDVNKI